MHGNKALKTRGKTPTLTVITSVASPCCFQNLLNRSGLTAKELSNCRGHIRNNVVQVLTDSIYSINDTNCKTVNWCPLTLSRAHWIQCSMLAGNDFSVQYGTLSSIGSFYSKITKKHENRILRNLEICAYFGLKIEPGIKIPSIYFFLK